MKKAVIAIIFVVFLSAAFLLAACADASETLKPDFGYEDYASLADFDTGQEPAELDNQGLFWTKWDDGIKNIVRTEADTDEGAALFDPQKPVIIFTHGMQTNDYDTGEVSHRIGDYAGKQEDFGYGDSYENGKPVEVDSLREWLNAGYNVGYFNYVRFADEGGSALNALGNAEKIAGKFWGTNGASGMRYRKSDGSFSEKDAFEFSLAEIFAGEYMRAANLIPNFEGGEVRFVGHSMGGMLQTANAYIIGELAERGQIDKKFAPTRLAVLDGYLGKSGQTVMLDSLAKITERGVAVEYYYDSKDGYTIRKIGAEIFDKMGDYAVCAEIVADYYANMPRGEDEFKFDTHNLISLWYMLSVSEAAAGGNTSAPNARTSTAQILEIKGLHLTMSEGGETLITRDDVFSVRE